MSKKTKKNKSGKSLFTRVSIVAVMAGVVLAVMVGQKSQNTKAKADFAPLWAGDMEEGNLNDWFLPGTESAPGCCYGGGEYNNNDAGNSDTVASTEQAHSGIWSTKSVLTNGSGGTRMFRWLEARANRDAYYSAWVYIPQNYTLTASPTNGQYWNLMQFKSRTTDGSNNDPLWAFYASNGSDGQLYLHAGWGWGQTNIAGPTSTDNLSGKNYSAFSKSLPIGRWVHLEAFLHQSKDFDGRLSFWQDGELMFDMNNIKTSYNNCNYNAWCADNEWSVNLYSDGLSPNPATIYIDDAVISLTQVSGPSLTPTPTTVSSDITSPSVAIISPSNGAIIKRGSTTTITANASDNVGVTKVKFYVNGTLKCTDTIPSYSCLWNVPTKRNVTYTIKAIAYDAAGNSTPSSVTVTAR